MLYLTRPCSTTPFSPRPELRRRLGLHSDEPRPPPHLSLAPLDAHGHGLPSGALGLAQNPSQRHSGELPPQFWSSPAELRRLPTWHA